jgi:hypothetical protein
MENMFQSVTFLRAYKVMDFHIPISYISQVSKFLIEVIVHLYNQTDEWFFFCLLENGSIS